VIFELIPKREAVESHPGIASQNIFLAAVKCHCRITKSLIVYGALAMCKALLGPQHTLASLELSYYLLRIRGPTERARATLAQPSCCMRNLHVP
jgi:hypothetical protein